VKKSGWGIVATESIVKAEKTSVGGMIAKGVYIGKAAPSGPSLPEKGKRKGGIF